MSERRATADAPDEAAEETAERVTEAVVDGLDALEDGDTVSKEELRALMDE